jgi:hypothetical protein
VRGFIAPENSLDPEQPEIRSTSAGRAIKQFKFRPRRRFRPEVATFGTFSERFGRIRRRKIHMYKDRPSRAKDVSKIYIGIYIMSDNHLLYD